MGKTILNRLIWIIFGILTIALTVFFLRIPALNYGGDIAEYHGITESLVKDGKIYLTPITAFNIETYLQPAYLKDPGYYIAGRDGNRYPVHFIFYSILALSFHFLLKLFSLNELDTLRITNLFFFSITAFVTLRYFVKDTFKRFVFMILFYLSPLVWFIYWSGPDVYYTCLLLLSLFSLYRKRLVLASILLIFASWHSQPLLILVAGLLLYYLYTKFAVTLENGAIHLRVSPKPLATVVLLAALTLVPYAYNYYAFGILTPWTILKDGWTQIYGFGLQNMSLQKFFEQFLDLNIGLLWYFPVGLVLGLYFFIKAAVKEKLTLLLFFFTAVTIFFYQTNPAWNYGTSGYGPTRHILFLIPFLLFFTVKYIRSTIVYGIFLALFTITQLAIMSYNGFLAPKPEYSLYHSPLATYVIEHYPAIYNPTPEIFVDRTTHMDVPYPESAIYKVGNICKKAYILKTDGELLTKECGPIKDYDKIFDNEYLRKANIARKTKTIEATFWPDPGSCAVDFVPIPEKPYICMHTKEDFAQKIGLSDLTRVHQVENFDGVWRLEKGDPIEIIIPQGYFIQHYSFEGTYVTF